MDAAVERGLVEVVGRAALLDEGRVALPSNAEQVAAVVRVCHSTGTPMSISSGPARPARSGGVLVICLSRLTALAVDDSGLTLRAEAGVSLADARAAAERAGRAPVGLPVQSGTRHLGGAMARGELPRRTIAGIELVLPTGDHVVAGGRVLKDVTGYDLAGLALGSMGRLAIIVAARLRLQPRASRGPAFPPAGKHGPHVGPALIAAFDPAGLLRPGD